MSCPAAAPAPLQCPTLEQSIEQTLMLLPRGRAWPGNDRGILARFLAWLGALAGVIPVPAAWPAGFVQVGYFAAFGAVRNYLETRLCALRLEFWCATQSETRDEWMADYGLPDDCDPFPDLCVKVAALGGRRCELYQALCARLGWVIDCVDAIACTPTARAGQALAGHARASGRSRNQIEIVVHLHDSPSYTGDFQTPPLAGRMLAGMRHACAPNITPLQCLMDRIAPAHVIVSYTTA